VGRGISRERKQQLEDENGRKSGASASKAALWAVDGKKEDAAAAGVGLDLASTPAGTRLLRQPVPLHSHFCLSQSFLKFSLNSFCLRIKAIP
jgi:hypothetical protein